MTARRVSLPRLWELTIFFWYYQFNHRFEDHNSSREMTKCLNNFTNLRIAALLNLYEVAKMKSKVLTNHISVQELTKFCTKNLWEVQLVLYVNLVDFNFSFWRKKAVQFWTISIWVRNLIAADRATEFCTKHVRHCTPARILYSWSLHISTILVRKRKSLLEYFNSLFCLFGSILR